MKNTMINLENAIYEVTKEKTDIKGFWVNDKGKLFIDNIKLFIPKNAGEFNLKINTLFLQGENSVFFRGKNKAFCLDNEGNRINFESKIIYNRQKLSFNEIKNLLHENKGLTIFKINNGYIIELWKD